MSLVGSFEKCLIVRFGAKECDVHRSYLPTANRRSFGRKSE